MELTSALRTTGAVRGFTADPVDDATVAVILDDARFAPSGGNQQPWKVAVVKSPAVRAAVADLMRPVWEEYVGAQQAGKRAFAFGRSTGDAPVAVPNALIDGIQSVPVVLVVAADLNKIAIMDGNAEHRPPVVGGASIYPFCWSILLAARERGLGGVLTTFLARAEAQAAPLLGLPRDHAIVATLFLGVPVHQNTKLKRNPVESFTTIDRFDGPPLQP
ncbi:MAG: nitroreductase family protein [Actinomycetota bacterium]